MKWMKQSRLGSDAVTQEAVAPRWGFAVSSGILGWILDAFDFFVLVFLVDVLANNFHVRKGDIVWSITITLAMRPVGALLLGSLADRFGRRRPADGLRALFLHHYRAHTICAELSPVRRPARTLRNWHGRILGHWRLPGDGELS